MDGWIKIHRKMLKWGWYQHPVTSRLFFHLLLLANHEPREWMGHKIEKGQLITGRKKLAKDLKISERTVRTSLNHLKSTNELTIKSTNRFTLITINNYNDYQLIDQQNANNRPATDQQPTTNKNEKNEKKIKEKINKKENQLIDKKKYGEEGCVSLTEGEYLKLCRKYGRHNVDRYIQRMENWKLSKGKKYKNDYRALLNWLAKAIEDGKLNISWQDFSMDDFETDEDFEKATNKYAR